MSGKIGASMFQTGLIIAVSGAVGLIVHSLMMYLKDVAGILPGFAPYDHLQRFLEAATGGRVGWIAPYVTGATLWGALYARLHDHLPGRKFWVKGIVFAVLAWGVMATAFFWVAGYGLLGLGLGEGLWPALLIFPMLATFSLSLSFIHTALRR
jgi:hypothetical protein